MKDIMNYPSDDMTRNINPSYNKFSDKKIGEITGNKYNNGINNYSTSLMSTVDLRTNKKIYDTGNRLFELYDKKADFNISYYDGGLLNPNYSDVNINDSVMSYDDPIICFNNINLDYGCFLLDNIINLTKESKSFSPYSILSFIICLYASAKYDTETLLKNYFKLPQKELLFRGLNEITKYIKKTKYFKIDNFIILNSNIKVNEHFIKYINNICKSIIHDAIGTTENIIASLGYKFPKKIFHKNQFNNFNIIFLSCMHFKTIWDSPFDKIIFSKFNNRNENMLYAQNKKCYYYEDSNVKLVELAMCDQIFNFGFIISKTSILPIINDKQFKNYIKSLKYCSINEIMIPKINLYNKIRLNSIIQKTGLNNIFEKIIIPEFVLSETNITDILQNISIDIDNNYYLNAKNTDIKINSNFICNKSFIYYLRCVSTDSLIIIGQYH